MSPTSSFLLSAEGPFLRGCFSIFVKFQLGDFTVGWVDGDLDLRAVLLVLDHFLDMDAPSASVNGEDLTRLAFDTVFSASFLDEYSVSLSDWERSTIILGLQFFARVAAHHLSSQAAVSREMSFSTLSSLAGNSGVLLHI